MSTEKDVAQVMRIDDKDWFLQNLISMVNKSEITFGITLNVGGFLVSGDLVGGKEYFEGFGTEFAGMFSEAEGVDSIQQAFAKNGEIYSNDEQNARPHYVHIKNAKFFHSHNAPVPDNRGVWWRCRVSEVSGFYLGSLRADI